MKINIKDVVLLANNQQFAVASKANYKDTEYYYLISLNNNEDILICSLNENEFVTVTDTKLINTLLPLFFENSKDLIPKKSN